MKQLMIILTLILTSAAFAAAPGYSFGTATPKVDSVTSATIVDGSIVNADVNAAAGIVDTKLATIATAGKVSDTALSSNVPLKNAANAFTADQTLTGGVNALTVGVPTTADATADTILASSATTQTPLVIQGVASQSVPLMEVQNSTGAVKASIDNLGIITAGVLTNEKGFTSPGYYNSSGSLGFCFSDTIAFNYSGDKLRMGVANFWQGLEIYSNAVKRVEINNSGLLVGANGTAVSQILKGSATLDFASTIAQATTDLTITVTGAAAGDTVALGIPAATGIGTYTAWVSAADTVTVRFANPNTVTALDPASGTFIATVVKF